MSHSAFSARYRTALLGLLLAAYTLSFVDRIIIAIVGPAVVAELGLSDLQFGLLGGTAFALFYSLFGLPIAWLAERRSRVDIISVSVALWSAMTVLCGFAQTYWQLLLCRIGVGVGEAGCSPPAHSLISDHYPPERRASALAVYAIGVPAGVMLGAAGGGWLAETFDWRTAFIVVGAPGIVLALIIKIVLREPPRGHSDGLEAGAARPQAGVVARLVGNRTFVLACAGCSLLTLAGNGINLFTPTYLVRSFDMGLAQVGLLFGLAAGASGVVGLLAGGIVTDRLGSRDARWYAWVPAVGGLVATPFYLLAYTRDSAWAALVLILVGGTVLSVYFAPTSALVQNLFEPRMRATAAAVLLLAMNVVGQAIGSLLVGGASDAIAGRVFTGGDYRSLCVDATAGGTVAAACEQASAQGLRWAMVGLTVFLVIGSLGYLSAARSAARAQEAS